MTTLQSIERYAVAAQEDRCAPRTRLRIPAQLRPSGDKAFATVVLDLSLAGFSCDAVTGMKPGTICWLTLPSLGSLQSEVAWNNGAMVGCSFQTLLNPAVLEAIVARYS